MGWHVLQGDPIDIAAHVAEWADFLEVELYPVIEDAEAATALSRVFAE
jgi:hypothetical protein